ncbi:MAG: hypothetical protein V3T39_00290 [Gammaproteobacteria bacterium]
MTAMSRTGRGSGRKMASPSHADLLQLLEGDTGRKVKLNILIEERRRANAVRGRIGSELLNVLLGMKEAIQDLREKRTDLAEELRGKGVVYDNLYAKPYDRICEVRSEMLQRFTRSYSDIDTLLQSDCDVDDIARDTLLSFRDDLLEVLHLLIDGLTTLREYRSDLGRDLVKKGDIYVKLYDRPFNRVSIIRDSIPILMNAVFGRRIVE